MRWAWARNGCVAACLLLCLVALPSAAADVSLARQLADEGDWEACRRECRRVELQGGSPVAVAALLRDRADAALGNRRPPLPAWKRVGALPVVVMVGFYRLMVAPALGSRCLLDPSCSRYSMQAARERGWLGIPMTGDRLIREPSVVVAREKPIEDEHGHVRFADPVSDHIGGASTNRW
jgi:hypothetical protein